MALNHPVTGPMRTVDLFPYVMQHLGHAVPEGIDGVLVTDPKRALQPAASS
jgi:hypothetical protein